MIPFNLHFVKSGFPRGISKARAREVCCKQLLKNIGGIKNLQARGAVVNNRRMIKMAAREKTYWEYLFGGHAML